MALFLSLLAVGLFFDVVLAFLLVLSIVEIPALVILISVFIVSLTPRLLILIFSLIVQGVQALIEARMVIHTQSAGMSRHSARATL